MIAWLPVLAERRSLAVVVDHAARGTCRAAVPLRRDAERPLRRVRTPTAIVKRCCARACSGRRPSPMLVAAVERERRRSSTSSACRGCRPTLAGQLVIVPLAHAQRYVRIQIVAITCSPDETIALIGHELRHALEVAAAPEVSDRQRLAELYRRIGEPGGDRTRSTRAPRANRAAGRSELAG